MSGIQLFLGLALGVVLAPHPARACSCEDGRRDKVIFEAVRSAYVKRGEDWVPEHAHYTRTDRPMYSITADGRVTAVDATAWGEIKDAPESRHP